MFVAGVHTVLSNALLQRKGNVLDVDYVAAHILQLMKVVRR